MTTATPTYDSAAPPRPVVDEVRNLWSHRSLIRLLVARDLTVRYKRSVLGVWWTVLNPILTTAVMWFVFSRIFGRDAREDVPFIVYLLTGVLLIPTFFSQGVLAAGNSLLGASGVLSKMRVPGEVFAFTAALAAGVNFAIGLIPLVAVILFTGTPIPWTFLLIPIPAVAMLCLVTGVGMLIASLAVHFHDVLDFIRVLLQLVVWLVPTFYPIDIIPDNLHWVIHANPLYSYLIVFRAYVYKGEFGEPWHYAMMFGTALAALVIGVYVFSRSWRNVVVKL